MNRITRLKKLAAVLEIGVMALAVLALLYRATLFWQLGAGEGGSTGALVDFGLALLVFLVAAGCATVGVAISLLGAKEDKRHAYQAFFIGVISFIAYDWLHPVVPRLM